MMEVPANMGTAGLTRQSGRVPAGVKDPELYRACRGFEAYFARYLVKQMNGEGGIFGKGVPGADIYRGMFEDALGEEIAGNGALGIADILYRQLSRKEIGRQLFNGSRPGASVEERLDGLQGVIRTAAKKHGVDEQLIRAVIRRESAGMPTAVSHKGARGLMQLLDETAADLGVGDPFDINENVDAGTRYLKQQIDTFGDIRLALAAYNAGPARVRAAGRIPDIAETREYVNEVMKYYRRYLGETRDDPAGVTALKNGAE